LEDLNVTEFFDLKNRVLMRNELPPTTSKIFKLLKITPPKRVVVVENTPEKLPNFVDTR
jgi:hypothetical protein